MEPRGRWLGSDGEEVGIYVWLGSGSDLAMDHFLRWSATAISRKAPPPSPSDGAPSHAPRPPTAAATSGAAAPQACNERDLGLPTSGIWDRQRAGSGIANERDLGLPTSGIWDCQRAGSGIDDGVWDRRRAGFCTLHQSECGSRFAHPSDPMRIACAWNSPQMIIARRSTQRARCLSAQPAQFTRRTRCAC